MGPRRQHQTHIVKPTDRDANPAAVWVHCLAAMGNERWEEAIASWPRFLALERSTGDQSIAYRNLAACYLELERYDEALAALDEAERAQPGNPETLYSRAIFYACAGRIPPAIAALDEFTRRWPSQAHQREVRQTLRHLKRIRREELPNQDYLVDHLQEQILHNAELGDMDLVERKARRMLDANPRRVEGHYALGVACLGQKRYPEALASFRAAAERNPRYESTLFDLGYVLLQLEQPEEARSWLERARRQSPRRQDVLNFLGVACEQLGRRDEAVAWWRKAMAVDPYYELAQQRLYEIGQGPPPVAPPPPPVRAELQTWTPVVKARMRRPVVLRSGSVVLTYDGTVGFVLEDEENEQNGTVHAGGPFITAPMSDEDVLDLVGVVKLLLRLVDAGNTRDVAVLAYYADGSSFNYQDRFERDRSAAFQAHGHFIATEMPRFFKLRIDSDLATPYGNPMQGTLIYLDQRPQPGVLVSTLPVQI
jgi:tetratricopeptide (TPR) repeat protein